MNELVVSNIHLVLQEHLNRFEEVHPEIHLVYHESLDYEAALAKYRSDNLLVENSMEAFPLLAFNRSVLRYAPTAMSRRSVTKRPLFMAEGSEEAIIYKAVHAEFDFQFVFLTPDYVEIENFEVAYLAEESIGHEKEFLVGHHDIGDLPYFVRSEPLDDLRVNIDGAYYKAVGGRSTISGHFLMLKGTSKIIKEIHLSAMEFSRSVLCQAVITQQ